MVAVRSEIVHQHRQQPNQPVQLQQPGVWERSRTVLERVVRLAPSLAQVCLNLAASGLVSHLVNASGMTLLWLMGL